MRVVKAIERRIISRRALLASFLSAPLVACQSGKGAVVRFRLIATAYVDGKALEASTVMEARYYRVTNSLIGSGGATKLYAEAMIFDLGGKGTVFILPLQHLESGPLVQVYEYALLSSLGIKKGIGSLSDDDFKILNGARGRFPFNYFGALPAFVAFTDEAKPQSIFEINPFSMSNYFPGVRFAGLDIEITDASVTSILLTRLPWLRNSSRKTAFARDLPGQNRPKKDKPLGFIITEASFFGDGSAP